MTDFLEAVSSDGRRVLEANLGDESPTARGRTGVLPDARRPGVYTRLLRGACAELGPGRVEVDSWGDDPAVIEAYKELGSAVVERTGGWQFQLG